MERIEEDNAGKEIVEVRKDLDRKVIGKEEQVGAGLIHTSGQGFRPDHRKRLEMVCPWKDG